MSGAATREKRVVVLVGGGSAFTPALVSALCDRKGDLPPLELRLVGRDPARVATIARFSRGHAVSRGADFEIVGGTSLDQALPGAAIVVNQMRVGGFAGRSHDETFPLRYGLPGDETIGPGGLANAIRSAPATLALARKVEAIAPEAFFLQLSNPMSILLQVIRLALGPAVRRGDSLRFFGLCELPQRTLDVAAHRLGIEGPLDGDYFGVNHQGFFTAIREPREARRNLLPELARRLREFGDDRFLRFSGDYLEQHQLLPLHYFRLLIDPAACAAESLKKTTDRGRELAALADELFDFYAANGGARLPEEVTRREMPWNALATVPAIVALLGGPPAQLFATVADRADLGEKPGFGAIEQRMRIDARGATPMQHHYERLHRLDLCRAQLEYFELLRDLGRFERFATVAAHHACIAPDDRQTLRGLARTALLSHPLMERPELSERLLDEILADVPGPPPP